MKNLSIVFCLFLTFSLEAQDSLPKKKLSVGLNVAQIVGFAFGNYEPSKFSITVKYQNKKKLAYRVSLGSLPFELGYSYEEIIQQTDSTQLQHHSYANSGRLHYIATGLEFSNREKKISWTSGFEILLGPVSTSGAVVTYYAVKDSAYGFTFYNSTEISREEKRSTGVFTGAHLFTGAKFKVGKRLTLDINTGGTFFYSRRRHENYSGNTSIFIDYDFFMPAIINEVLLSYKF